MARIDLYAIERQVAASTGVADPNAIALIQPGAVFVIDDRLIVFPENPEREPHEGRHVIVVQAHSLLGPMPPHTASIVPCSASRDTVHRYDYAIPAGTNGFSKANVVAHAALLMPVLKSALTSSGHRGYLPDETYGALLARIAANLGLAPSLTLPPR
jgi:hypothetical protein